MLPCSAITVVLKTALPNLVSIATSRHDLSIRRLLPLSSSRWDVTRRPPRYPFAAWRVLVLVAPSLPRTLPKLALVRYAPRVLGLMVSLWIVKTTF